MVGKVSTAMIKFDCLRLCTYHHLAVAGVRELSEPVVAFCAGKGESCPTRVGGDDGAHECLVGFGVQEDIQCPCGRCRVVYARGGAWEAGGGGGGGALCERSQRKVRDDEERRRKHFSSCCSVLSTEDSKDALWDESRCECWREDRLYSEWKQPSSP